LKGVDRKDQETEESQANLILCLWTKVEEDITDFLPLILASDDHFLKALLKEKDLAYMNVEQKWLLR
jgi:hypothetical protein